MADPIRVPPILTTTGSLSPEYFHRVYAEQDDPWDFQGSAYEAAKYDASLAALPRERYAAGLEVGCSIGVLTRRLAERCSALLALDVSEQALERARDRCADRPQVTFQQRDAVHDVPTGRFDLIVLSEIAYYWSRPDLERVRERLARALTVGGHLLLVHYTGETNYPQTADEVHEAFLAWDPRVWTRQRSAGGTYRLDLLEKVAEP